MTSGTYDVWRLVGARNAATRALVMSKLIGRKVTQAQAGINALSQAFYDALHITGDCDAAKNENLAKACRARMATLDQGELIAICKRWARVSRSCNDSDAEKFAFYYAKEYPNGNKDLSWVFDYKTWRR